MKSNKVYALMTVRNRIESTLECVECLKKQSYQDIEIVIVDDGSTDNTAKILREKYKEGIKILKGNGDLWWTGGMNLGLQYILRKCNPNDDFVLLLNNDIYFDENFVRKMLNASLQNEKTIVGSLDTDGKTQKVIAVRHLQKKGITTPDVSLSNKEDLIFDTNTLNARGTVVPVEVFSKTGFFSKRFPHYHADYDFFYRAKRAGYKLAIDPKATIYSQDDDKGLSGRIREKKKISLKEFLQLFFSRRSSFNLYSRMLLVSLYTPFPQKIYTLCKILLNVPYVFFKKVL